MNTEKITNKHPLRPDRLVERSCSASFLSPVPGCHPGPPLELRAEHPAVTAEGFGGGGGGGGASHLACKTPPWPPNVSRRGGIYNRKYFFINF